MIFKFYPISATQFHYTLNVNVQKIVLKINVFLYYSPLIVTLVLHVLFSVYLMSKTVETIVNVFTISKFISLDEHQVEVPEIILDFNDCRYLTKNFLKKRVFKGNFLNFLNTMRFFKLNLYFSVAFYLFSVIIFIVFLKSIYSYQNVKIQVHMLLTMSAFFSCADIDTLVRSTR